MPRYFIRNRRPIASEFDDWYPDYGPHAGFNPLVSEHEAIDTGLVDANGDPIMRAPNPMGFGKDDEW